MLYQHGANICLPSLRIRAMPFLGTSSNLVTFCNITVSDLIDTSGRDLFRKLRSSEHSLHHLLPPERKYSKFYNHGHLYKLPDYCAIVRVLTCVKVIYYSMTVFVYLIFHICDFNRGPTSVA